jgi:allantoinase
MRAAMRDGRFDALITGGTLVTETSIFRADIGIRSERIACLSDPGQISTCEADAVLDATGMHVMPGAVDPHFHAGELKIEHREDFASGTSAAAAGGYTTVVEMPLSVPPVSNREVLDGKVAQLRQKAVVDCALWGALIPENLHELPALREAGVVSFKAFMTTVPEYPRVSDEDLYEGMATVGQLRGLVGVHAENHAIIRAETRRLQGLGRKDLAATAEAHPPEAELAAVHTALAIARVARCPVHIVHASTPDAVAAVAQVRRLGQDATVETCAHYLAFTIEDLSRLGPMAKCGPPLRTGASREGLWQLVLDGTVDMVGSDHTPASIADKSGHDDAWTIFPGIQGVQSVLPFLLTDGVHRRGLSLPSLVRLVSAAPARRFGLFPRKGTLYPGADADIVLIDLDSQWTLHENDLKYKHRWSPYAGMQFRGEVMATLVRGRVVYRAGEIEARRGYGRWLPVHEPPSRFGG